MNRSVSHRSRPGFTLPEVIIMVIVAVILIGLLLPATVKVRGSSPAASRRTIS